MGAGDDGYYCFGLEPGADGKAQLIWHAPHERCIDAETSPAVHDGLMFAGLGMGNGNFIESAEAVKRKELEKLAKAGKTDAEIAAVAETLGTGGEIWCLEEKTGKVRWTFVTDDTVLGAVAADSDRLFASAGSPGARKGLLAVRESTHAGETRGTEVWFAATTNGVTLSPAASCTASPPPMAANSGPCRLATTPPVNLC